MPLLVLCDPGFAASVGVSKPAGASVADCCAIAGHAMAITPSSNTRVEGPVRIIVSSSEKWVCPRRVPRRREGAVLSSSWRLYPASHGLDGFFPDGRGRPREHPWGGPGRQCHGAVASPERTGEMRSERKRAGRERGRRAAPRKLERGARRWAITAAADAEAARGRRYREDGTRQHV